jgi:hypothetical protein
MPTVRFLYTYCNDLEAMRRFYVDLLGLTHTSAENGRQGGFVEVDCGGFRLTFMQSSYPRPVQQALSKLPGVAGGSAEQVLCSVEYDADEYQGVVARLCAAGVAVARTAADWNCPVLDPMGNTVEVYRAFTPEAVPAGAEDCAVSR